MGVVPLLLQHDCGGWVWEYVGCMEFGGLAGVDDLIFVVYAYLDSRILMTFSNCYLKRTEFLLEFVPLCYLNEIWM